jgi:predicted metal-dependent peptidase
MSVNKALDSVLSNNLDEMRTHFSNALSTKAVEKLEERKSVIAKNYFGVSSKKD